MRFSTTIASFTSLAASTIAAPAIAREENPHIGDFSIFPNTDCSIQSRGQITINKSWLGTCRTFNYEAVSLQLSDMNEGCTLTLYTDKECSEEASVLSKTGCSHGDANYKSAKMECWRILD